MKRNYICFFVALLFFPSAYSSVYVEWQQEQDSVAFYVDKGFSMLNNDFSTALKILEKADALATASNDPEDRADVAYAYGYAYYVKGSYDLSLQYYLEALEIYQATGNQLSVAKSLVGQGLIQQGIDRNRAAINLFNEAIDAYNKSGDPARANPAYLNIAISQIEVKEYEKALGNLQMALELSRKAGRVDVEHLALNRIAQIKFFRGNYDKAIEFYFKVLNHQTEPNNWEKSFTYAGLAQVYAAQEKYELAEEMGQKALVFARDLQSIWDLERNTGILSSVYQSQGKTAEAFEYLSLNQQYRDSLYNQNKLRAINLLQLESKEGENLKLQSEKEAVEKQLFTNRIFLAILVLAVSLLLVLAILYRKNIRQKEQFTTQLQNKNQTISEQNRLISKQNEDLSEMNEAKNRLFSILSHDLRSPLASLEQLLGLIKSGDFTPEEQASLLDEMLVQVSGTSSMLQNLLHWANSQLEGSKVNIEKVDLPQKAAKIIKAYYLIAKRKNIKFIQQQVEDLPPVMVDRGHICVILHNLLSNAIKFTREGKEINISFEEQEETVLMSILDGGEGISQEKINEIKKFNNRMISEIGTSMETGTGIGLMLVKHFLGINEATLDIKNHPGKGAEFIVAFRKA
ncbi:tetratricopeptide repeat-containing sensor histidine kinase [Salinimicrobium sp. WS361]|uniref:ATP-binding protein n=1 Tax=Salinimicrobium sp. WS361 TaxID=3425123 RepID=UPI003D6F1504